jgi:nucleoside-diphosphate-sugar epimerase
MLLASPSVFPTHNMKRSVSSCHHIFIMLMLCQLRTSVTVIIHNAWRLDFNLSLSSFEPNIRGTRNLIDIALTSPHAEYVRFLFTSSIGVTLSWPHDGTPFPEEPQADPRWCVGAGYGEGKYVGEQVSLLHFPCKS